jgi:plasmid maintenance system killer protein
VDGLCLAIDGGAARGHEYRRVHFHSLRGDPQRWPVRVTGNFRITFGWSGENALDVDFEDYH